MDTGPSDSLEPESNVPGAKPSKKKSARLGKQDHAQKMEGKVPGDSTSNDTPKEVEFVGGSALVVEGGISSVAPATEIDTLTNGDIVKPTHVEQGNTESLSLPAHVTIWAEGDPDLPLEEVVAEPEEGVEYLDYEGDQVGHLCSLIACIDNLTRLLELRGILPQSCQPVPKGFVVHVEKRDILPSCAKN